MTWITDNINEIVDRVGVEQLEELKEELGSWFILVPDWDCGIYEGS